MRYFYIILMVLLTGVISLLLYFRFRLHPLFAYVIAINMVTFIYYGWDKLLSIMLRYRIAEKTLHVMALMGGSIGAYVGQKFFHHKTIKKEFRQKFFLIIALQMIVLLIFWGLIIYWV